MKLFLHENSILYLKFLKYSLIHADRIRFYFCLIKQKSLLWYFVKDEYITDDWLKRNKYMMCSLIYVLCAFNGLLKKSAKFYYPQSL